MNEVNRSNYVVDLGTMPSNRRTKLHQILKDLAIEYNWTMLGWGSCKKYFRFGYVDNVVDPEYVGDAGFYYWTADSMRSDNYKVVSFSRAIELLTTIDKTIVKPFTLRVGSSLCEVGHYNTKIGCKNVDNGDLRTLRILMNNYDITQIAVTTTGSVQIITWSDIVKLTELIKQKG